MLNRLIIGLLIIKITGRAARILTAYQSAVITQALIAGQQDINGADTRPRGECATCPPSDPTL